MCNFVFYFLFSSCCSINSSNKQCILNFTDNSQIGSSPNHFGSFPQGDTSSCLGDSDMKNVPQKQQFLSGNEGDEGERAEKGGGEGERGRKRKRETDREGERGRERGREREKVKEREGGDGKEDGGGGDTCSRTVLGKQPVNQRDSNLAMDCPTLLPNS